MRFDTHARASAFADVHPDADDVTVVLD